ncbi:MAG TPA: iron uptake transporter deferrochelatase/peroxidase subunit [Actinomycetales bacterium]|nr:iron uptake transporter deferrochelatase/peroxidase subunit [Actinomycetales bacterium]
MALGTADDDTHRSPMSARRGGPLSRRGFLGGVGAAGAGIGVAAAVAATHAEAHGTGSSDVAARIDFHGEHQAGIGTASQDRLAFAAFDLTTKDAAAVRQLLHDWTAAAAAMTAGALVPGSSHDPVAPPADTGEAVGLPPSGLTVTVGFGPTLFDDRFGLASRRPAALNELPPLPGDELAEQRSGGDIAIQACSNDPQVAFHVIRNLARIASGTAVMRWSQLGFGRTSSTSDAQSTPRNLFGFKDGTRNIHGEERSAMDEHVWVSGGDQPWMEGGTYLVARRIRMLIESWDRDFLADQQEIFGRFKTSGAPLTGHDEFEDPDYAATSPDGRPVIADTSHIRLASPENNGGLRILRRGFSYTDGMDPTGLLDAGLFFICFTRDPQTFVTLQRRLGAHDALNEYIKHTGSGLWACPSGLLDSGGTWADHLFA